MLNDGNVTVAAIAVVVLPASWLSRGLAGRCNSVTIRFSDTPFQTESLPGVDPMVVALTLLGHDEAGEFGAGFGDVSTEAAQLEPGPRDPGVHGVPGCSSTTAAPWCCRSVQGQDCGLGKNNHRASDARHVAAEDDADAATGRNRQPQWAQVGDVGVVPAAGKNRLGTRGVSRK